MRTYGCLDSKLIGNENIFNKTNVKLYKSFDLRSKLSSVTDQGEVPKCVSVALTDMIRFKMNIGYYKKFPISDDEFYLNRKNKDILGMEPIDALNQFTRVGINGLKGNIYAKVDSVDKFKYAIISNGPLLVGIKVNSFRDDFWNGSNFIGYHAVLFVGYNKDGFILRNSWGTSYGINGYTIFPYSEYIKITECWTLIS
jgi:hypothetical protein